jgi:hypothetical protein
MFNTQDATLTLADGANLDTNLLNSGTVQFGGSPGEATVAGLVNNLLGVLKFDIGGTVPGTEHDQLVVVGTAELGGILNVQLIGDYTGPPPASLDTVTIITAGTVEDTFATEPPRGQGGGLFVDVAYTDQEVHLEILNAAPGDANGDRSFDFDDIFLVLSAGKYQTGQPATWGEGDWTGDHRFDFDDIFDSLASGLYATGPYAAGRSEGPGQTHGVPEPSGWALVLGGLIALAARSQLPSRSQQ